MRFCQSFMTALYRYIGPDVDVPAGDMGVGGREIGYLYGQYRRLKGVLENGVLTGKGFTYGGSLTRPEATGYGAMYYLQEVLKHEGEDIKGKTIACAGFGNVTWGICKKAMHLGAKVVTLSGPDGYIYDPDGVSSSEEKIDYLLEMRDSGRNKVQDYADKFGVRVPPRREALGREGGCHHALRHAERRAHGACQADRCQRREVLHRSGQHAHHQRRAVFT